MFSGWTARVLVSLMPFLLRASTERPIQFLSQTQVTPVEAKKKSPTWKRYVNPHVSASGQHTGTLGASGSTNSFSADLRLTGQPINDFVEVNYELGFRLRPLVNRGRLDLTQFNINAKRRKTILDLGNVGNSIFSGSKFVQPPRTLQAFQSQTTVPFGELGFYLNNQARPAQPDKIFWGLVYEIPPDEQRRLMFYHFSAKDELPEQSPGNDTKPGKGTILGFLGEGRVPAAIHISGELALTHRDSDRTDAKDALNGLGGILDLKGQIVKIDFNFGFSHLGSKFGNPLSPGTFEDCRSLHASVDRRVFWFDTRFAFVQSQTNLSKKAGSSPNTQKQLSLKTSFNTGQTNRVNLSWQRSLSSSIVIKDTRTVETHLTQKVKIKGLNLSTQLRQVFFSDASLENPDHQTNLGLEVPWRITPLLFNANLNYDRTKVPSGRVTQDQEAQFKSQGRLWQGRTWLNANLSLDLTLGYRISKDTSGPKFERKAMRVGMSGDFWMKLVSLDASLQIATRKNNAGTDRSQTREYRCEFKIKPPVNLFTNTHVSVQAHEQQILDRIHPHHNRSESRVTIGLIYRFDFR